MSDHSGRDSSWNPDQVLLHAIRDSISYERKHGGGVGWGGNRESWERDIAERFSPAQRAVVESYIGQHPRARELAAMTGLLHQWFVFECVLAFASRLPAGIAILERDQH